MDHKNTVVEIIKKLEFFKKSLDQINYSHEGPLFIQTFEKLKVYVASIQSHEVFDIFYHSKYFSEYKEAFEDYVYYYMRATEMQESFYLQRTQFADNNHVSEKVRGDFMKTRFHAKIQDFKKINTKNINKMVMIGCGSIPETVIFAAENFSFPAIIGIDENEEAVYAGGDLVNILGLTNVFIKRTKFARFNYADADLIYIGGFVQQKNAVLNRIAETASENTQIIIESPVLMGKLFFEEVIPAKLHPRLKITDKWENKTKYFHHEILKIEKYKDI